MSVIVSADREPVASVAKDDAHLDSLNRFMRLVGKPDERAMVLSLATFIEAKSFLAASASELDKVLPGRAAKAIPAVTGPGVDTSTRAQVTPQVNTPQDPPTSN